MLTAVTLLLAGYFQGHLKPIFSERGSIRRPLEESTYVHFMDFLEECEGMNDTKPGSLYYIYA